MRIQSSFAAKLLLLTMLICGSAVHAENSGRSRLLVLTDVGNEPDDAESIVRLLVYANEFDIEGLVATTSQHLRDRIMPELIRERIDAYGQVLPTLSLHAPGYPSAQTLHSLVKNGSPLFGMSGVGAGKDTEGSDWIITVADRADSRPLWISVWGGANTLAQALWKVRATRTPAQVDAFVAKLRVYTISDQDDAGAWIRTNFPNLFYIVSPGSSLGDYGAATWSGFSGDRFYNFTGPDFNLVSNAWVDQHVQFNHGPLGAKYPDIAYIMEGDTPAWLYLFPTGLNNPERPDYGSWGGRYVKKGSIWTDTTDRVQGVDGNIYTTNKATIWRWRTAYQNDFQARMDWCVQPYSGANHPPIPMVQGTLERTVLSGTTVTLSAAGSTDPDGNSLNYNWMFYKEPGTYQGDLVINTSTSQQCSFVAPSVPEPQTIHVILTVSDTGTPSLHRYRRVIITVTPSSIPYVNAGADATIPQLASVALDATVTDDGQPGPLTVKWSQASGPGTATFANVSAIDTTATFSAPGTYVLRLTASDGANTASDDVSVTVVAQGSFFKGVNFNGNAVSIEGNTWLSHSAALSSGLSFSTPPNLWTGQVAANPPTDAATQAMLNSAAWINGGNLSFSQTLSNGTYTVYFWVIENYQSNYRSFDIKLEGKSAAAQAGTLTLGAWKKYGPFPVTISDGALSVEFTRITGDPHVMGMAIYTASGTSQSNPTVSAGADQTVAVNMSVNLDGTASDDGTPGPLTVSWSKVSGPGTVTFASATSIDTTATFSTVGVYTLRLTASDTAEVTSDDVVISVVSAGGFVKGINFNGAAVTIEGNAWLSYSAALDSGLRFTTQPNIWTSPVVPTPTVDADMRAMLSTNVWSTGTFGFSQTIGNGTYDIYLWVMENYQSNFRSFNVNLEGQQSASNIGTLAHGSWVKYGPYRTSVTDGMLNVDLVKNYGDPHIMGIAIFNVAADSQAPTVPGNLAITGTTTSTASLSWNAASDNVQVAGYEVLRNNVVIGTTTQLSFTDTGLSTGINYTYTVKAYDAAGNRSAASAPVSVTLTSGPAFVKGINFNGNAVTIEGNTWLSYSAALSSGLSFPAAPSVWTSNVTANPAPDAETRTMLATNVWSTSSFGFSQTISNGSYDLYLWVMENYISNFRSFNVNAEGVQVASNIGTLPLGAWMKYGPYRVNVSDGSLNINLIRNYGDPHVMGLAIYSVNGTLAAAEPNSTRTVDTELSSGPAATPNPANVGMPVSFTVAQTDASTATCVWNFGDGTGESGQSVTHTYAVAGTYTATVQISHANGTITTGRVEVVVTTGSDLEAFTGNQRVPFTIKTFRGSINFNRPGTDALALTAVLSADTTVTPTSAVLSIGGTNLAFEVDRRGRARSAAGVLKYNANTGALSVRLNRASLGELWQVSEKAAVDGSIRWPLVLVMNEHSFYTEVGLSVKSSPGKFVRFKKQ
ncbi:MAG TPA: nucleoside hydrolase-like domain-containing protein [Planctomycetota bacterium]|nr:nucleoside hydrolase-like domain-containing protein [Planctomycetota bacterium]